MCGICDESLVPEIAERIYFNPKKGDRFFHVLRNNQQVKIDHAAKVYALDDGSIYGLGLS
jgi:hypothetical protein